MITCGSRSGCSRPEMAQGSVEQVIVEIVCPLGALPVQSVMPAPVGVIAGFFDEDETAASPAMDLRAVWSRLSDPRDARGRRHSLVAVLSLVQAAVTAGADCLEAIFDWIWAAPQEVLAQAGAWRQPRTGRYVPPHPDTISGLLACLDMAEVDAAYTAHRAAQLKELYDHERELIPLAVDGKSICGSAHGEHRARHRLGAHLARDGVTLAQLDVDGKHNEISAFVPLLEQIESLKNIVVLADRLHTQRGHATYLHKRGAFYLLPVGGNQPRLFAKLDALPWKDVPISWMTYDRGHGRAELRTLQVLPAPAGLGFPHVRQVFLLERHIYNLTGELLRIEAVLGVTSLPQELADPEQLTQLIRDEWSIENRDHHVRDATYREDARKVHTGSLPSLLAVMRSHAISALRLSGFTNIAKGLRWARDDFTRPFTILGLTS